MSTQRIVVIGTSSGGIDALRTVVAGLPPDFSAPICVVAHTSPQSPGVLDDILGRAGRLPAAQARTGDHLVPGRIYVAPPDRHLLVEPGTVRVTRGPQENRFRPAIDPLFRSAAQVYGPAAVGVILTGNLDDGTAGLWAIKRLGGVAVVQDPADAVFPSTPRSALQHVEVDHCVPLGEIASLLGRIIAVPVHERGVTVSDDIEVEIAIAKERNALDAGVERIAEPSSFACPECHGVLLRLKEMHPTRFRCHTGHAYSIESLLAAVTEAIDGNLWSAIRSLEEGRVLLRHLSNHLREQQTVDRAEELAQRAESAHRKAELIRSLVSKKPALSAKE